MGPVDVTLEEGAFRTLRRSAGVAMGAAGLVIGLKLWAWGATGSLGLLSDALESLANLAGAVLTYLALVWAHRPPDEEHAYGHSKAEYFASGFEGALILVASGGIVWAALGRFVDPQPLASLPLGLGVAAVATVVNLGVARILLRVAARHRSVALEASGRHLMTDVWTSVGILVGVGAVGLTGWLWLDPALAVVVAFNILATGLSLVRRSAMGLLDTALSSGELGIIAQALAPYEARGIQFHALRTRRAGRRAFISVHVLVPGGWTVQEGHDLAEEVEETVRRRVSGSTVFTHLEPVEDPASFQDQTIHPPG
ncbi:MAG: cation diffusion facilitator family transporter [Gemmatimonadota bacterium]